jgi:hypothetical protein
MSCPVALGARRPRAHAHAQAGLVGSLGDRLRRLLALTASCPRSSAGVTLVLLAGRGLDRRAVAGLLDRSEGVSAGAGSSVLERGRA